MDQSFGRCRRLLSRNDYNFVFDAPDKRSSDRYFTVLGRCRAEGVSRIGLVIAKKRIARAHERNRVKRLVRESFRCHESQLMNSLDLVLMAKSDAQQAPNDVLYQSLTRHWRRIGL